MNATNQQDGSCEKTVKPAGIEIKEVKVNNLGFQISFPNPRHNKPLPTIAEVAINDNNEMEISIVVFVSKNTDISSDDLCVIQDFSYTNDKMPYANFYVCYDIAPEPCSAFNVFQLTFNAINSPEGYTPNGTLPVMPDPNILDLKEIVSFLWDEDPVGSRGTVTTVKSA
ncbi:hypothetical protein [Flavobacterium sp. HNIBRBA15423]|uniref:hypothetical protein n=1 Tax=Flavobacterium sp. HNIBRBA15423 TaxID=3458683 RepID=UPI0040447093